MESYVTSNNVVQPLLTDLYQVTMAYAYWKNGKSNDVSVFDLYFRKNPFQGEFTIFAGLEDCIKFLINFKYSKSDIKYLQKVMKDVDENFWIYIESIDASEIKVSAVPEGSVVFPRVPLLRIEGPLPIVQLLETTLLNLVNYASLVATNAARFRLAAGPNIQLLEFGLRRAQGPDGGLSASKYCYIGGFDGTSNVLAGKKYGIPIKGTHAHSFVNSFQSLDELTDNDFLPLNDSFNPESGLLELTDKWLSKICDSLQISRDTTHKGERAAFLAYAKAFPNIFLCLIDTYSVLKSGLLNFLAVTFALSEFGYKSVGIRLDSGDLAYQSRECRQIFKTIALKFDKIWIKDLLIVASNDINEETLHSLKKQSHQINSFGIGTHLVTCQKQPALGCVFKLVELNKKPRIKLSEEVAKIGLPGKKETYRLYNNEGMAVVDLIQLTTEQPPQVGVKIMVRHPMVQSKRAYVIPYKVQRLHNLVWNGKCELESFPALNDIKNFATKSLNEIREDVKRELNPTPYKVNHVIQVSN